MDGSRFLNVYADPISKEVNINQIADQLEPEIDAICAKYPGVTWRFTGTVRDNRETAYRTKLYAVLLMFALYALLAIPFKSLLQPVFVLIAVPFGIVGALLGHIILDITPSYLSIFGLLALSGVVVNDSLVMVDFTNQRRKQGFSAYDAVINSGANRFRPIVLTSLTTFAGLMPLIFERAIHAQFLIPMAVSLGFGILFATVITLFLIPCCYLALEDLLALNRKFWIWFKRPFTS
jgi:multidrug efflux pump subunit AcrB